MREIDSTLLINLDSLDLANLSRKQAANLCGVSLTKFDGWWKKYGMPYYELPGFGNQKRFNYFEIVEWQKSFRKSYQPKRNGRRGGIID